MPRAHKNWIGVRCGRLLPVEKVPPQTGQSGGPRWLCVCDCGNKTVVRSSHFKQTKSCGCLNRDGASDKAQVTRNYYYATHCFNARKRNLLPLSRAIWDVMSQERCFYCGNIDEKSVTDSSTYKQTLRHALSDDKKAAYRIKLNGIDRIDSNKNYAPENCVSCCEQCNQMKNDLTTVVFIEHVKRIQNYQLNPVNKRSVPSSKHSATTLSYRYRCHCYAARKRNGSPLDRNVWERLSLSSCHYCGEFDLSYGRENEHRVDSSPEDYLVKMTGIDRVDSAREYTEDNVVSCCRQCNRMKLDYDASQYLLHVNAILNHLNNANISL